MSRFLKIVISVILLSIMIFLYNRFFGLNSTYFDRLELKLSPYHREIENSCTSSSPDLWIVESVNNKNYSWIINNVIYCLNSKVQYQHKNDTIMIKGYLQRGIHISDSDCEEYYIFQDEKIIEVSHRTIK